MIYESFSGGVLVARCDVVVVECMSVHEFVVGAVLVNCESLIVQCLSIVSCCAVLEHRSCCAVLEHRSCA